MSIALAGLADSTMTWRLRSPAGLPWPAGADLYGSCWAGEPEVATRGLSVRMAKRIASMLSAAGAGSAWAGAGAGDSTGAGGAATAMRTGGAGATASATDARREGGADDCSEGGAADSSATVVACAAALNGAPLTS